MAVLRIHLGRDDIVNGLAVAVVLKGLGLLEPLLADGGEVAHVVVVAEVGLGGPGRAGLSGELAGGVEVDLGLDAVEVDVGDGAVGSDGVGRRGGIVLGEAVSVRSGGRAGIAQVAVALEVESVAFLRAVHTGVLAGLDDAVDEVGERHRDAGDEVGIGGLAVSVEGYALDLGRGLADAVVLEGLDLLEPLGANAGGRAHRVVVAELHLALVDVADGSHERAGGVKLGLALDGVDLAVDDDALAVDGDGVDVDVRLSKAVAVRAGVVGAAVALVIGGGHVEAQRQLALRHLNSADGLALGEHGGEGSYVHGAAGDEVDFALGDVAVLRVHLGRNDVGDGLAVAVVLKGLGLLEPLLAYGRVVAHGVVIAEVGLGGPGRTVGRGQLTGGVEVDLGLDAVEVDVTDGAVGSDGVGRRGGIVLGEAVTIGGGGSAGVAQVAVALEVEGVAFLRAVHTGLVAGVDNAVDEVGERHGDAGDEVGVGSLAVLVKGNALDLGRSLADAVLLKSLDLLEPLGTDAGSRAHRVVIAELHLALVDVADLGHESAGGIELGLALDGVDLAVDDNALAVDGDGVDVDVRLSEAVAVRAGVVGAAVALVIFGGHVEAQRQFSLRHDEISGRSLRLARCGRNRQLDNGDSAAGKHADTQKQSKCDRSQLLHFVLPPDRIALRVNYEGLQPFWTWL